MIGLTQRRANIQRMQTVFTARDGRVIGVNKKRLYEGPFVLCTNPPDNTIILQSNDSKTAGMRVSGEGPMQLTQLACLRDSGFLDKQVWQPLTVYGAGTMILPTVPNGFYYLTAAGGMSGLNEPNWPRVVNRTVVDGTITWACQSLAPTNVCPTWANGTGYALGDLVIPTVPNGFFYECTVAGNSGGGEPTWPTVVGATVTDNTVTWTCRAYIPLWQAAHTYVVGSIVRPTTANGFYYRATVGGVSGATEPTWPTVAGLTVGDGAGALMWIAVPAPAAEFLIKLHIQDGTQDRPITNNWVHRDCIFGTGGQMYPLPDAIYVDDNRSIAVTVMDISNNPNRIRLNMVGGKYSAVVADPTLNRIKQRLEHQQHLTTPGWYTLDDMVANLNPGEEREYVITIAPDQHFEAHQLSVVSTDQVEIDIIDMAKGESIITAPSNTHYPVNVALMGGISGYPYRLPQPVFVFAAQQLRVILRDVSGAANTVYLALGGAYITVRNWS